MPQINFSHIVSFSSEDSNHPASNLLSKEIGSKRWICQKEGESSCSVVLQLEKSVQITSIHIGNHHSAIIEVLVGRSEASNSPFEVLLCASTFMTPGDSRNSTNISRVRTFDNSVLSAGVKDKKWDRVRIVCTQPYNKHVQYGLTFVHIFSSTTEDKTKVETKTTQEKTLGKFKLRDPSSDEDDIGTTFKPGELFSKLKNKTINTDAQIRQASSPYNLNTNEGQTKLVKVAKPQKKTNLSDVSEESVVQSRKRDELFYDSDDNAENNKIDKIMERDKKEKEKQMFDKKNVLNVKNKIQSPADKKEKEKVKEKEKNITDKKNNETNDLIKASSSKNLNTSIKLSQTPKRSLDLNDKNSAQKRRRSNSNSKEEASTSAVVIPSYPKGPMCLKGVVFVLSGYVNPKRSNLRDSALGLGAKYSPDWGPNCTHLVCAFANTPKHDQVKKSSSGAIIVNGQWLEDCGKEQAHLPWQWYALDSKLKISRPVEDKKQKASPSNKETSRKAKETVKIDDSDTEDEIERIMQQQEKDELVKKDDDSDATDIDERLFDAVPPPKISKNKSPSPKIIDKEDNCIPIDEKSIDLLPDLLSGILFYVDPSLADMKYDTAELKRYIWAYGGEISEKWPEKNIDVAITAKPYTANLLTQKPKKCLMIRPEWVWKCNDTRSLYEFDSFILK